MIPSHHIRLISGALFNPLEPELETFPIDVIAHALSHICRFTGHTRWFYSVAQHSVIVADMLADQYGAEHGRYGLLHDAPEAFVADVSRPVKHHPTLGGYRAIENRLQRAIYRDHGLLNPEPSMVKAVDTFVLDVEMRDLMVGSDPVHRIRAASFPPIVPLSAEDARAEFLSRYAQLWPSAPQES